MRAQSEISATVLRERSKLGSFIRRRVSDPAEAEDILQDVLSEFVEACRLPEPIERVSAWLLRSARNRIVDFFRRRSTRRETLAMASSDGASAEADEARLELELPSADEGPEAAYWRSVLLSELQAALDELPAEQRQVFMANEMSGVSFKEMAAESGLPLNTLLARKRYAVLHLRKRLQRIYDELEI
jgi:RNA polymerase sigma factor (sigma-70 family)